MHPGRAGPRWDGVTRDGGVRGHCQGHSLRRERAASGDRHPGHGDRPEDAKEVLDDLRAGRWDALDLPGELLEVDVDEVDVDELAARLRN